MSFIFFNDTATTEIYTLSLHDALPISKARIGRRTTGIVLSHFAVGRPHKFYPAMFEIPGCDSRTDIALDRKSTRLNSSHANISYAVFCLKKKISLLTPLHFTIYPCILP